MQFHRALFAALVTMETSVHTPETMVVYGSVWLVNMVVLASIKKVLAETVLKQRAVHHELFLPTQICTSVPGAKIRWLIGHSLISCSCS